MLRFHEKRPKKRVKFSPEEDELLKEIILHGGSNNWVTIASLMPNRNVRQCKERWMYHILPVLPKKQWTSEEDEIIISKYKEFGKRWFKITPFLQDRSQKMVKDRIQKLIRDGVISEVKSTSIPKKEKEQKENPPIEKPNEHENIEPISMTELLDTLGGPFDDDIGSLGFLTSHMNPDTYEDDKKDQHVEILSTEFDPIPNDHHDWDKETDGTSALFLE